MQWRVDIKPGEGGPLQGSGDEVVEFRYIELLLNQWEGLLDRFGVKMDVRRRFYNLRFNLTPCTTAGDDDDPSSTSYTLPMRRRWFKPFYGPPQLAGKGKGKGWSSKFFDPFDISSVRVPLFNDGEVGSVLNSHVLVKIVSGP
jgi:hypothetical protein